jgi:hypothetical protein
MFLFIKKANEKDNGGENKKGMEVITAHHD